MLLKIKSKEFRLILFSVFLSLIGTVCANYLFSIIYGSNMFSKSILSFFFFIFIAFLLNFSLQDVLSLENRSAIIKRIIFSLVISFLISLALISGYQVKSLSYTLPGLKGKLFILMVSLGLSTIFFPFLNMWFHLIESVEAKPFSDKSITKKNGTLVFLISYLAIFICWIPVFLAYYPAIMSYDFHSQSIQAFKGFIWFNAHHPLIHTFLIWSALKIGGILGSYQTGMAFYSIFQMLLCSAIFAYMCNVIYRITKKIWPIVVTVLFIGLFPTNAVLALCVTKDIIFAAFFILTILLLSERVIFKNLSIKIDIFFVLSGIVMVMFRNNAIYAFALFTIYYILVSKGKRIRALITCILIIVLGELSLFGIQSGMQAGSGSKIEMCSLPLQQITRTAFNQKDNLTEEEYDIINYYVPEEYWNEYNPTIVDSVKSYVAMFNFDNWTTNWGQTIKDWLYLGTHYPNEYIDAFLCSTAGYWFFDDTTFSDVLGTENHMGIVYTNYSTISDVCPEGISLSSKLPSYYNFLENIISANSYQKWPVLSLFFVPAFYCWILIIAICSFIYKKSWNHLVLTMFPLCYLLTLYLGPVVQIRYALPYYYLAPFLFALLFTSTKSIKNV